MKRVILHSDLNNFYASVECLYRPELRDKPVAVCGDPAARHGIVLAKNYHAKRMGVITGEAIWQAKQKCPGLVIVMPDYKKYLRFALLAREIYSEYSDRVEPFGLDEAWLDVSPISGGGDGGEIADEIRNRIRSELGITVSVGVADNKVFAKLGSDMKKPDATTVITRDNFRNVVWPLPVDSMLYVGRSTRRRLYNYNILTIGDLARFDRALLRSCIGKWGDTLWCFANGLDASPVAKTGAEAIIKSVGNSLTPPRDMACYDDVKTVVYALAESVAMRLREHGFVCRTVRLHVRDSELLSYERQAKLARPSQDSQEIAALALRLFCASYGWSRPVRSVGVCGADLAPAAADTQLSFFDDAKAGKRAALEAAIDGIRGRFGHYAIQRALMLCPHGLGSLSPREDHPISSLGVF